MTEYHVTLPLPQQFRDAVEYLNGYGEVVTISPRDLTLMWAVEAETPFELAVILGETLNEAIANNYFDYGSLDPRSLTITPDPRGVKK